jgi:hypothetical protein
MEPWETRLAASEPATSVVSLARRGRLEYFDGRGWRPAHLDFVEEGALAVVGAARRARKSVVIQYPVAHDLLACLVALQYLPAPVPETFDVRLTELTELDVEAAEREIRSITAEEFEHWRGHIIAALEALMKYARDLDHYRELEFLHSLISDPFPPVPWVERYRMRAGDGG